MKTLNLIIGTLAVVGASAFASPAEAATSYRTAINHAAAACMGALPVDRNKLEARSMGLTNVQGGIANINCGGAATPYNNNGDVEVYETALRNNGAASIDVNCMLVDGLEDGIVTVTTSYPKTLTLAAGAVGWIDWTSADNAGKNFIYPAMTCQLPGDVAISYTAVIYQVDVGL